MPPHFPVEDTSYETKQWASATIDSLFSDNVPVSFEPCRPSLSLIQSDTPTVVRKNSTKKLVQSKNPARRSVSVLESSLFHRNDRVRVLQSDRASLCYSDSAPSLLITPQQQQPRSLSFRFKRPSTPPEKKRMLSLKEREGIDIWRNTLHLYLSDSKMVSTKRNEENITIYSHWKKNTALVSSWSIASFTPLYTERIDNYRDDVFGASVYYKAGL